MAAAAYGAGLTSPFTAPGEYAVTVPAGVTMLHATLVGGEGGAGSNAGSGGPNSSAGFGSSIQADLSVTPGEILYLEVGGNGLAATAISRGGDAIFQRCP